MNEPRAVAPPALSERVAQTLVFLSSASVLVVEITALRLLAPHLGLTLETSTLVIALALTAIAAGSWLGGQWADAQAAGPAASAGPRRLLAPLLAVSGAVVAVTPFLARWAGEVAGGALVLIVAAATIVVPGVLLSAVTPIVTKLRLTSLDRTGSTVGRLSAVGTVGAIVGTVVTGFVLISRMPVSWILIGTGLMLVASAVVLGVHSRRLATASIAAVLAAGALGAVAPSGCDAETMYHCAQVRADPERSTGRMLVLDGLFHSYVDLADPTYLRFAYIRMMVAGIDAQLEPRMPLRAHHLGGGGITLPRYLAATRPGTLSTVSEIDPGVVALDRSRLDLRTGPGLQVRVEDARLGLARIADGETDLVVGDAFGGLSVPWHLTTRETVAEVRRVLRPGGVYAVNVIDYPPLAFARAEVATLASVFTHVALAARPDVVDGRGGGNIVLLASDEPIDLEAWQARLDEQEERPRAIGSSQLRRWAGQAPVLTDDYAPVDQLLTPYR